MKKTFLIITVLALIAVVGTILFVSNYEKTELLLRTHSHLPVTGQSYFKAEPWMKNLQNGQCVQTQVIQCQADLVKLDDEEIKWMNDQWEFLRHAVDYYFKQSGKLVPTATWDQLTQDYDNQRWYNAKFHHINDVRDFWGCIMKKCN